MRRSLWLSLSLLGMLLLSFVLLGPQSLWGGDIPPSKRDRGRVPDEFESDGGHSLGFGMGGMAAVSDQSSVRANPAMLVFEKVYQVSAGYHWPSVGRNFYQAGVVDSKTSNIAAGVSYTSSLDKYKDSQTQELEEDRFQSYYDTPIKNRVTFGLAQPFGMFAGGMNLGIVSALKGEETVRGTTLGFGVAGLLTPFLRFGVSVENLGNGKVKDLAPRVLRGGLAYTLFQGNVTAHLDYRQRERVPQELYPFGLETSLETEGEGDLSNLKGGDQERMVIGSCSVRIQDLMRLLGSYGQGLDGGGRRTLSGGVALVNKAFSLSYLLSKPYMDEAYVHQAVNLSMQLSI